MSRSEDLLASLSALDPVGDRSAATPPPFDTIEARIALQTNRGRARRIVERVRSLRMGLLACVAVLLGGGTVALAATGVLRSGAPIDRITGSNPHHELGVAERHQSGLLSLRIPDPAGGPAWGMRYIRTSRGLGCLEVGRVVHGLLGVLGRDDVSHNDGLFHPFAENSFDPMFCGQLDGEGHAHLSETGSSFYAAGVPLTGNRCEDVGAQAGYPACPTSDERELAFGLAGPAAKSITYEAEGKTHTQRTVGSDGAYLVVLPVSGPPSPGTSFGQSPREPITAVTYRNGTVCPTAPRPGLPPRACDYIGFVLPRGPRLPAHYNAQIRVSVTSGHFPVHVRRYAGVDRYHLLHVSFRAPVATTNAESTYVLEARAMGCNSGTTSATTRHDIRKGEEVTLTAQVPEQTRGTRGSPCGKRIKARLGFSTPTGDAARDLAGPDMATEPTKGQVMKRFIVRAMP